MRCAAFALVCAALAFDTPSSAVRCAALAFDTPSFAVRCAAFALVCAALAFDTPSSAVRCAALAFDTPSFAVFCAVSAAVFASTALSYAVFTAFGVAASCSLSFVSCELSLTTPFSVVVPIGSLCVCPSCTTALTLEAVKSFGAAFLPSNSKAFLSQVVRLASCLMGLFVTPFSPPSTGSFSSI